MTVDAIKEMELGHLIDFVEEYNKIHDVGDSEKDTKNEEKDTKRPATQADWDALLG